MSLRRASIAEKSKSSVVDRIQIMMIAPSKYLIQLVHYCIDIRTYVAPCFSTLKRSWRLSMSYLYCTSKISI